MAGERRARSRRRSRGRRSSRTRRSGRWCAGRARRASRRASQVGQACPNCGAPLAGGETIKCRYCGALVCSGEHDWVLAEITQLVRVAADAAARPRGPRGAPRGGSRRRRPRCSRTARRTCSGSGSRRGGRAARRRCASARRRRSWRRARAVRADARRERRGGRRVRRRGLRGGRRRTGSIAWTCASCGRRASGARRSYTPCQTVCGWRGGRACSRSCR